VYHRPRPALIIRALAVGARADDKEDDVLNDISIRDWWNLLPRPPHWVINDKVVTVKVSAAQFNDLGSMNKITAQALGRLGCTECHSGFDIRYLLERDFRVNPAGEVVPDIAAGGDFSVARQTNDIGPQATRLNRTAGGLSVASEGDHGP